MPASPPDLANCAFCAILRGDAPAIFVHQDDLVVAFMDIRPVQPGHVLVVPRTHAKLIPELDAASRTRIWLVATHLNRSLRDSTLPVEAVSVYIADGEAAGQAVAHVHIHLIPRLAHDSFGFRFPVGYGFNPPRSELEAIAGPIRQPRGS